MPKVHDTFDMYRPGATFRDMLAWRYVIHFLLKDGIRPKKNAQPPDQGEWERCHEEDAVIVLY
jgi:hypothetical protein